MTITTRASWTSPVEISTIDALDAKVNLMVAAGQTDGIKVSTENSPVPGEFTIDRTWVDTAAAQEWIDFLQPFNPVSAAIIV